MAKLMNLDNEKNFFTPEEFAKYLKVAKSTVYTYIQNGELPAVKLFDRKWRLYYSDVKIWLEKNGLK
jgi:excisionase family DNA binding protein